MALRCILTLAMVAALASAQQKTISSSTRPEVHDNADGALEGTRPEAMLDIVKSKGTVKRVDVQARTVELSLAKAGTLVLAFSQPAGREQIKVSKKTARKIGQSRLRLEELQAGAKVRVQYYPLLEQLLEVVVD